MVCWSNLQTLKRVYLKILFPQFQCIYCINICHQFPYVFWRFFITSLGYPSFLRPIPTVNRKPRYSTPRWQAPVMVLHSSFCDSKEPSFTDSAWCRWLAKPGRSIPWPLGGCHFVCGLPKFANVFQAKLYSCNNAMFTRKSLGWYLFQGKSRIELGFPLQELEETTICVLFFLT